MSFDLGVFYTAKPHSDNEATMRYVALCEAEKLTAFIEPSESVAAFLQELTAQYPEIDAWPQEDIGNCPWSGVLDVSAGHVLMPMIFSKAEEMYPVIADLAKKHGLVCVDPQSSCIVTTPPGLWKTERPWWQLW